jgi:hypothetical protein
MLSTSLSRSAADRLRTALDTLIRPQGPSAVRNATVTELCRRADISRHSLYRYHADILEQLRTYQQRQNPAQLACADAYTTLHAQILALRVQRSKLVALVDHYYLAFRESSALLARRERELAEMRRSAKSFPTALRR